MKLVVTIADPVHVINVGGELERTSEIIEIADETLPPHLRRYLECEKKLEENPEQFHYLSVSFSILTNQENT